jgi:hypothetical protein
VTDSATFPTPEADDEETGEDLGGLDDLLASVRSNEEPATKRGRGRVKKEAPAKDFKALLKRYKYPPDQEAAAIDLVLTQAEELSEDLIEAV